MSHTAAIKLPVTQNTARTEGESAPPPESTRRLTLRAKAVQPTAKPTTDQLMKKYEHVVRQIAGGFQRKLPRNVLRDDLIAAGMSGLWDALRRQGHEKSGNFDWYVRVRIRGAILDELRAQDWLPRRARAAAGNGSANAPMVLRFDEVSDSEQARCLARDDNNAEAAVEASYVRRQLQEALEQLPERERRIVSLHYFRGMKFKDLGEMLGVSEPRISQLHSRAMGRLKGILAEAA